MNLFRLLIVALVLAAGIKAAATLQSVAYALHQRAAEAARQ